MVETVPHLAQLLEATFPGSAVQSLQALKGEASTRRYYRVQLTAAPQDPEKVIVMRLPDEAADGPARTQAHAFLDVQRFLSKSGLPVPRVYAQDIPQGLLLLEDLGDDTFDARLRSVPRSDWDVPYASAIALLAQLHSTAQHAPPEASIALRRRFETTLLRWELDHFREWGLEALHGPLAPTDRAELDKHFDAVTAAIAALPLGFVHRDYQSRNLMWAPDGRLCVIDFQDAFIGPAPYDLVALLCDSYVDIDASLQDAMLLRYAEERDFTAAQLTQLVYGFRLIAVQRKLKDAGRFVFIDRVRGNPSFLPYYPGSLGYVARALQDLPGLAPLAECLRRLVPAFPS
jgi:aminoglycoside/choline kinase family phosphotransferase